MCECSVGFSHRKQLKNNNLKNSKNFDFPCKWSLMCLALAQTGMCNWFLVKASPKEKKFLQFLLFWIVFGSSFENRRARPTPMFASGCSHAKMQNRVFFQKCGKKNEEHVSRVRFSQKTTKLCVWASFVWQFVRPLHSKIPLVDQSGRPKKNTLVDQKKIFWSTKN